MTGAIRQLFRTRFCLQPSEETREHWGEFLRNVRGLGKSMVVFRIESLYGLAWVGFVWNFATFARLSFEQFSAENSYTWLGSFSYSKISVEMFRFSI